MGTSLESDPGSRGSGLLVFLRGSEQVTERGGEGLVALGLQTTYKQPWSHWYPKGTVILLKRTLKVQLMK